MNKEQVQRVLDAAVKARDFMNKFPADDCDDAIYLPTVEVINTLTKALAPPNAEPVAWPDRDELEAIIAGMLRGTYNCTRVWTAWQYGTMSQDDFCQVDESETPGEIADEILGRYAVLQPAIAPTWQQGWDECAAHFGLDSAAVKPAIEAAIHTKQKEKS